MPARVVQAHCTALIGIFPFISALARISHQFSTAAADPGLSTALRSVGLLDILSCMSAGLSVARIGLARSGSAQQPSARTPLARGLLYFHHGLLGFGAIAERALNKSAQALPQHLNRARRISNL